MSVRILPCGELYSYNGQGPVCQSEFCHVESCTHTMARVGFVSQNSAMWRVVLIQWPGSGLSVRILPCGELYSYNGQGRVCQSEFCHVESCTHTMARVGFVSQNSAMWRVVLIQWPGSGLSVRILPCGELYSYNGQGRVCQSEFCHVESCTHTMARVGFVSQNSAMWRVVLIQWPGSGLSVRILPCGELYSYNGQGRVCQSEFCHVESCTHTMARVRFVSQNSAMWRVVLIQWPG